MRATNVRFLIAALWLIPCCFVCLQQARGQTAVSTSATTRPRRCETSGNEKVTLTCDYVLARGSAHADKSEAHIALTHAFVSFNPKDESRMRVELTFQNTGSVPVSDPRTVYLAVDDDASRNYARRPLPNVDFRKLRPGQSLTFSDVLLIPALEPRHYTLHLWIPSADPLSKFDSSKDLLLDNEGVADPAAGLNAVGSFDIAR